MAARVDDDWADQHRATSRLVRALFAHVPTGRMKRPEALHALCRLTWIIKGKDREVLANTSGVVAPALSTLLDIEIDADSPSTLSAVLKEAGAVQDVVDAAAHDVGMVNFYLAFRNSSLKWLKKHQRAVWKALSLAFAGKSDASVRRAYEIVASLPALPRKGGRNLPPYNLLTPVLACLDPRGRSPIVNARDEVQWRLRQLGLAQRTLAEQFDALTGLIGQKGFADAFALDACDRDDFLRAFKDTGAEKRPRTLTTSTQTKDTPKPPQKSQLRQRSDADVTMLIEGHSTKQTKLHNSLTNALLAIGMRKGLDVEQGAKQACMFDALVREYAGTERDLLVEVKSGCDRATCRLAAGQLQDYRRLLPRRAATDLAVLFPDRPSKHAFELFGDLGIRVAWFSVDRKKVLGEVRL